MKLILKITAGVFLGLMATFAACSAITVYSVGQAGEDMEATFLKIAKDLEEGGAEPRDPFDGQ